ncbi:Meningioma expressed antigen 5 (Hyaluronidase), partial [Cichlidogyrus casuarinus]
MQILGLNSYLYAPKDDLKHRNHWRVPYNEEEEASLRELIAASKEHNVLFIFAISPGLDMVFSSAEDELKLKNKLSQIQSLGCTAFALLFDDIETRLCLQDFQMFATAASAQATITNAIYEHLEKPEIFMFCPTEYCETRAVPTVPNSDYLTTLGSKLIPEIIVMWTGPLVISKTIPSLSIRDLNRLLRREVAIWDNLHANDYDQRRLFLGPYSGRPLALKRRKLLRGILINPNCEFEANYVAMHTLAQWTRHADDKHTKLISCELDMKDVSDEEMFKHSVEINQALISEALAKNQDVATLILLPTYSPRESLINALKDWLALMYKEHLIDKSSAEPMDTDSKPSLEMQVEALDNLDIELSDLEIFADFFYLPFEHGPSALRLLELGFWLRENAYYANGTTGPLFHQSLVDNSL